MKKKLLSLLLLCLSLSIYPHKLNNAMLKTIDQAGFFNRAIINIIKVRQKVKELLHGKLIWHGAQISLIANNNIILHSIMKRPELLFGASFIIVTPEFSQLQNLITEEQKEAVTHYIQKTTSSSLLLRQEHINSDGVFTGSYVQHPITKQPLPIYVADYTLDLFDTRHDFVHIGIPGHISKDFAFAQKHHLPIKQVVTGNSKQDQPSLNNKQLTEAYTNDTDNILIINSNFLDGAPKIAFSKAIQYLTENNLGAEYKTLILYSLNNHDYSLEQLKIVEEALHKEHLELSQSQKESLTVILNYILADLLDIVEPFLKDIRSAKDIMIDLIKESCLLHNNPNSYMLKWSNVKGNESERVVFKRDITTLKSLAQFCSDLVDFLGDFASSCPVALENLKNLKKQ